MIEPCFGMGRFRTFLNEWDVWSMSMICNPILWQHQHTYDHYSFTNDFDYDPDLDHFALLLRVHKKCPQGSSRKYFPHVNRILPTLLCGA
jgi:hypothetical protein